VYDARALQERRDAWDARRARDAFAAWAGSVEDGPPL
jgi:hypothetical protein